MTRNIFSPQSPIPSRYRELRRWRLINGRRRVGVMGGTFDPIHHGHLVAGSEVAHHFGLDEVVFVPTGEPYQKDDRKVSPAEDRYLMTVIATASNPRFSVSRVDIDRPGPDLHDRHAARSQGCERSAYRPILHNWRRCPGEHPYLARRRRAVLARALHRLHAAGAPADRGRAAGREGLAGGDSRAGDLEQRVPSPGRGGRAGLVPGAGRRGPVHRETWTLRQVMRP